MATITIYLRKNLGRALSYTELDANFQNIKTAVEGLGITDLQDVVALNPQNGDIFVYNNTTSKWEATKNLPGSYTFDQISVTGMTQNNNASYFVSFNPTSISDLESLVNDCFLILICLETAMFVKNIAKINATGSKTAKTAAR